MKNKLLLGREEIPQRPAFRAFALEDEWHGRRRLRRLARCIGGEDTTLTAISHVMIAYNDAIDPGGVKWNIYYDQNGQEFSRQEHKTVNHEQAARDLFSIARTATIYLSLLFERKPELCKSLAARESGWPVLADLTEKDWQRTLAGTVSKLELGKDIKGYLLSARTADQNVVRCWATAIYETLFQTRFDFKRAVEEQNEYMTTEGCPEWARKTLDLPVFIKVNARQWARLGEEMILQQRPDFLESPDLAAKKFSWARRAEKDSRTGNASLRAVHREAFEDFAKELKNIAPEKVLWRGDW